MKSKTLNLEQELTFIKNKKSNVHSKTLLRLELLDIAQVILSNYATTEDIKLKRFNKVIYSKIKKFVNQDDFLH